MLAGTVGSAERLDLDYNPHVFLEDGDTCTQCHFVDYKGNMIEDEFAETLPDFCHGCHSVKDLGRSHPIGVNPFKRYWKLRLPDDFYLDVYSNVTCISCHTGHGKYLSTVQAYGMQKPVNPDARKFGELYYYKTYYVRRSDPETGYYTLCKTCHEDY